MDGRDYRSTNDTFTFIIVGQSIYISIPLKDNLYHDGRRFFLFGITSDCGINIWIQIFIWDDEWGRLFHILIIATLSYY